MKKIKELQERKTLGEGRNYGTGFSILNKIDDDKYETYLPFTACRDYLNDFAFCEEKKVEIGNACEYNHKVLNCFDGKTEFYFGINTLHNQSGSNWNKYDEHSKLLKNNYKNLEILLNRIEELLNLPMKSSIELDEETLIITTPIYWSQNGPLISAYTLLIRCFFNITDKMVNMSLDEIFKTHKPFIQADGYMFKNLQGFYSQILKDKSVFENINYEKYNIPPNTTVHNFGIGGLLIKLTKSLQYEV